MKSLHDGSNDVDQFDGSERFVIMLCQGFCSSIPDAAMYSFTTRHNQKVHQFILNQVEGKFIPVQRIACRCVSLIMSVDFNDITENVFIAWPIPLIRKVCYVYQN